MERAPHAGPFLLLVMLRWEFNSTVAVICVFRLRKRLCFGGMRLYVLAGYVYLFCVLMGSIHHFYSYRLVFDHEGKVARFGNAFQIFVDEAQVVS